MNLMHSICCLFRGRCASDAPAPTKAEQDRPETVETGREDAPAQSPPRPSETPSGPVRY